MQVLKISNFHINKQNYSKKIRFGNNFDKSIEFNSLICSFPDVKENNLSKQDEIEYDKCYKIIKNYLENNSSNNIDLNNGLINLAYKGHFKIVELLIKEYNANVNYKDVVGSTPIMYAAMKGHTKAIEILGKYGADINKKNNMGYSAIMLATMNNHTKALDKIFSINPVYINDTDDSGKTALTLAVIMENKEAIDTLIKYKANLDIKDKTGKTALMHAAGNLDRETMNKLIKAGADTKLVDNLGRTADNIYDFMIEMITLKMASGEKNIPKDLLNRYYIASIQKIFVQNFLKLNQYKKICYEQKKAD